MASPRSLAACVPLLLLLLLLQGPAPAHAKLGAWLQQLFGGDDQADGNDDHAARLAAQGVPFLEISKGRVNQDLNRDLFSAPLSVYIRCSSDGGDSWAVDDLSLPCAWLTDQWVDVQPKEIIPWEAEYGDTLYCQAWEKRLFHHDKMIGDTILRLEDFQRQPAIKEQLGHNNSNDDDNNDPLSINDGDDDDNTDSNVNVDMERLKIRFIKRNGDEANQGSDWQDNLELQISCFGCRNATLGPSSYWLQDASAKESKWPSAVTPGCLSTGLKAAILLQQGRCCLATNDSRLGDGRCDKDGVVNSPQCGWDFGDCCPNDQRKYCQAYNITGMPATPKPKAPAAKATESNSTQTAPQNGTRNSSVDSMLSNLTPADPSQYMQASGPSTEKTVVLQMAQEG